jgi:hypothetical protein
MDIVVHLPAASSLRSVLLLAQKNRVENNYNFKITFRTTSSPQANEPKKKAASTRVLGIGLNILPVAHALQLVVLRPPQTVMLT